MQVEAAFVSVTEAEFFALLYADTRDIMPIVEHPDVTTWETQKGGRSVWGYSTPGWKNPGAPKTFSVARSVWEARR